jgi:uncharacterized HAD superfamily protein
MMKVSFDIDGVLYDWHRYAWNKYFLHQAPYDSFWNTHYKSVDDETWQPILNDESLILNSGSAEIARMMQRLSRNYFIFYITSRPKTMLQATQKWLTRNGFPDAGTLYLTQDKLKVINKLEIDVHIDDRLEVLHRLADNNIRVVGVKQPWNTDEVEGFPFVENILEIERELARIETTMRVRRRRNGNE